jgi:glycosyltransferase involved in cell wall biosynthesis
MKLLFVIDTLGAGGSERSQMMVLDYLNEKGISFDVVLLKRVEFGFEKLAIDRGYNLIFLDRLSFLEQVKKIWQLIKEQEYDLVHSVLFNSNIRVRIARLFTRFIHLESLVSTPYAKVRFNDPKVNALSLHCYRWVDWITAKWGTDYYHAVNEAVKHHYVSTVHLNADKIHVVYRGRDCKLFAEASATPRSDFGFNEEDFLILNSGRHEFAKGQIHLLRALAGLLNKGYSKIKLLIIGREGESTAELKQYIRDNHLQDHVKLAGFRSDVPNVLKMANLFAFPSVYEGTAGALIEAAAASLPIVLNKLDSVSEIVMENLNACYFDVGDVGSIEAAILSFYDNPGKCKSFGEAGYQFFLKRFTVETSNNGMLCLYNHLLSLKRR